MDPHAQRDEDFASDPGAPIATELETRNSQLETAASAAAPILYDADADQRLPFLLEEDGVAYEVGYVLGPPKDSALVEYDRLLEQRMLAADEAEAGVRDAVEQTDNSFEAALWLFNDRLKAVDGFGEPGDELPANWRDLIGTDLDKAAVVDQYLAADVAPTPLAKKGARRGWKAPSAACTIHLRAVFEGYQLSLKHERQTAPTADQVGTFKAIMKRSWLVGGTKLGTGEALMPPKGERLGALYDQIGYRATGYQGRVPLHHKRRVVIADLSKHVTAVTKK